MESLTHSEDETIICGPSTSKQCYFLLIRFYQKWKKSKILCGIAANQEVNSYLRNTVVYQLQKCYMHLWPHPDVVQKIFCDLQFAKLDHISVSCWHISSKTGRWLRYSIVRTCKSGDHWGCYHCCKTPTLLLTAIFDTVTVLNYYCIICVICSSTVS